MAASVPNAEMVRLLQATPEQWAAVHRALGVVLPAAGTRGLMLLAPGAAHVSMHGHGAASEATGAMYQLQREEEAGVWRLVFEGRATVLRHEKGVHYVAWLLQNPPPAPIHSSELAARAVGDAVIDGQRNLAADDGESLAALRKARREHLAVMEDEDAPELEKEEARRELESINAWARRHARGTEAGEQRQARAIRQAIRRLLETLAEAEDETLRAFGAHVERHLWQPSSLLAGRRGARVRAGYAGRFTYEPPAGVRWIG